MIRINNNKLVIFGAGKIGRSFIGQLFSRGGYEVVFVDAYKLLVDELNRRGKYRVIVKSDVEETLWIHNVRAIYAGQVPDVVGEVATAGILAVSVGQSGLPAVMPVIAEGLVKRFDIDPAVPLDIIIAENLRNAAEYFKTALGKLTPDGYPLEKLAGFVETSIGKMVPIMLQKDVEEDMLQIFAEPYNTLILDKNAFKNPIPTVDGLAPKENMKAWVDRKLFIHNLGHATAAYLGYLFNPQYIYLHEALANDMIHHDVRDTMLEAAGILLRKYPGEFTTETLTDHIDDLLRRFQSKALGDTIFRVGCDLMRKLAADDRLSGAIRLAIDFGLPYDRILYALVCGFHFRAKDEQGNMFPDDLEFVKYYDMGIETVLTRVCGFGKPLLTRLLAEVKQIDQIIR